MHLSIDYPWYFYLFCLIIGGLFSLFLYFVPIFGKISQLPRKIKWLLSAIRFITISLIAFLFLSPLVIRHVHEKEKPVIIVAQDNSQSIVKTIDSSYYRGEYIDNLKHLIKQLSSDYEVVSYTFGQEVTSVDEKKLDPGFNENQSNISEMLQYVGEAYEGCNVGAVILATDGIYNKGLNPIAAARRLSFPIYTVAMGDTTLLCDARIVHVRHNAEVALGHKFPVEVTIVANHLKGKRQLFTVTHNNKTIFSQEIDYTSDRFSTTLSLLFDADKQGLQSYTFSLGVADGEVLTSNNKYTMHVNVIDQHQHIALVSAAPHPDVAAIRRALESTEGVNVSVYTAEEFLHEMASSHSDVEYDLAILHQIPTKGTEGVCRTLQQKNIPALYILGSTTDLKAFNALHTGITINTNLQNSVDATAAVNNSFASFTLDDAVVNAIQKQPPLQAPFGNYEITPSVQTLFFARIGNITSEQPLVAVSSGVSRTAFVFGEGLWRWRIQDLATNGQSLFFDPLVSQLVRYVSTQSTKKRLRVSVPHIISHDEHVVMTAEFLDDNLQLTNTPEVSLTLSDSAQKLNYIFNRQLSTYKLDLGYLPEGSYSYHATTSLAGKAYSDDGLFVITKSDVELSDLTANHTTLQVIASQSKAQMVSPYDLDSLYAWLHNNPDLKTVIHSHTENTPLTSLWWILLLIFVLLSSEWVLRKYYNEI